MARAARDRTQSAAPDRRRSPLCRRAGMAAKRQRCRSADAAPRGPAAAAWRPQAAFTAVGTAAGFHDRARQYARPCAAGASPGGPNRAPLWRNPANPLVLAVVRRNADAAWRSTATTRRTAHSNTPIPSPGPRRIAAKSSKRCIRSCSAIRRYSQDMLHQPRPDSRSGTGS